jgi:surface protein
MSIKYENKTIKELKEMCRMNNITSYSKLNKIDLIKLIKKNIKGKSKNMEIINYKENLIKGGNKKKNISKKMKGGVDFKANNESLREAVNMWCEPASYEKALETYGHINTWDTSAITDMNMLFKEKNNFNDDISNWNTHKVKDISFMFAGANKFNQPIGAWNTDNVINMDGIFFEAYAFNQPISEWNTDKVKNMSIMFVDAISFNQPIGAWNIAAVTDMRSMFNGAISFDQPISNWNINADIKIENMFENCPISEENKPNFLVNQNLFSNVENSNSNNNKPNIYTITNFINSGNYKQVYNLSIINNTNVQINRNNKFVGFKVVDYSNDLNSKKNYAYISIKLEKDLKKIIIYNNHHIVNNNHNIDLIEELNRTYQNYLDEIELQKNLYSFEDLKNNINNIILNGFRYFNIEIDNVNQFNKKYLINITLNKFIINKTNFTCIIYKITEDYFECIKLNINNKEISFVDKIRIEKKKILHIYVADIYFISELCKPFILNDEINNNINFEELLNKYEVIIQKLANKNYIYLDAKLDNTCYKNSNSNNNNFILTLLDIDSTFTYNLEEINIGIYNSQKNKILFIISYILFLITFIKNEIILIKNENLLNKTFILYRDKIIRNIIKFNIIYSNCGGDEIDEDISSQIYNFIKQIQEISKKIPHNLDNKFIHTPYKMYIWYIFQIKDNIRIDVIVKKIKNILGVKDDYNSGDN